MAFPLAIYFTSLGLGGLVHPWFGHGWLGLEFYLGLLLIPLILVHLDLTFHVPLAVACTVTALCAGAGWMIRLHSHRGRTSVTSMILHPIAVLPFIYLVLSRGFWNFGYFPSQWDEFSHWLLMPQQILLVGRTISLRFPFTYFADYTPGWALLVAYPFVLWRQPFDTRHLLWLPLLSSVGVVGLTFDWFQRLCRARFASVCLPLAFAWMGSLLAPTFNAASSLAPTHLLIEPPLENAWAALCVSLLLAAESRQDEDHPFVPLAAGIILAAGYLLKRSFLAALPLTLAVCAAWISRRAMPGRGWSAAGRAALAIFGPLAATAVVWTIATRKFAAAFPLFGERLDRPATASLLEDGHVIVRRMLSEASALLAGHAALVVLCGAALTFLGLQKRRRLLLLGWAGSCALYFTGLLWLYVSQSFPEREPLTIFGFERYAGFAFRTTGFLVITSLCSEFFGLGPRMPRVLRAGVIASLVALAWNVPNVMLESFEQIGIEHGLDASLTPHLSEGLQVLRLLAGRTGSAAKVVQIAQGPRVDAKFLAVLARYYSLDFGRRVAFRVIAGPLFLPPESTDRARLYLTKASPAQFKRLVARADVVWPVRTEAWMRPVLARVIPRYCGRALEDHLLVATASREGKKRFQCVRKAKPLSYRELSTAVGTSLGPPPRR